MKHFTFGSALMACLFAVLLSACGDDIPDTKYFYGDMVSSVPKMNYTAEPESARVEVTWRSKDKAHIIVDLFNVHVVVAAMGMDRNITIGPMEIDNVNVSGSDGTYTFTHDNFSCSKGAYPIEGGKLTGTLKKGVLNLTIDYQPGNMPFEVRSVYTSK